MCAISLAVNIVVALLVLASMAHTYFKLRRD